MNDVVGRTVRLFMVEGKPTGLVIAEVMNWTGQVLAAPRSSLAGLLNREEEGGPASICCLKTRPNSSPSGSDPTFETESVELDRPTKSNALAFWMTGARTMCRALPFFRLGAPKEPRETSFYVFNRVENGGFRWISYQEAREQEFVAPDEELRELIALGNGME